MYRVFSATTTGVSIVGRYNVSCNGCAYCVYVGERTVVLVVVVGLQVVVTCFAHYVYYNVGEFRSTVVVNSKEARIIYLCGYLCVNVGYLSAVSLRCDKSVALLYCIYECYVLQFSVLTDTRNEAVTTNYDILNYVVASIEDTCKSVSSNAVCTVRANVDSVFCAFHINVSVDYVKFAFTPSVGASLTSKFK